MTADVPADGWNADDWQAVELALGLLEGPALDAARHRAVTDPAFAAAARRWGNQLAPLLDEVDEAPTPPALWDRIASALEPAPQVASNDNGADLARRVDFWRRWSIGASTVAAALGLFLLVEPRPPVMAPVPPPVIPVTPVVPAAPAPMVAAMVGKDSDARLVATWEPTTRSLTVAAAGAVPGDAAHSHELWFIVDGGKPRSLGVMPVNGRIHAQLAVETAAALRQGTVLAISVEPAGGSPTGQPTGPVIASGPLLPT